jgi:DNA-binding MarR family transcriptional regulator
MARKAGNDAADGHAGDWRAVLTGHARRMYLSPDGSAAESSAKDPGLLRSLTAELGPMADEAFQIVGAFAIGARAQAGGTAVQAVPQEFEARLAIILNSFAPDPALRQRDQDSTKQIIQSELWQLLYKVRESAELSYAREIDLVELDRRILMLLRHVGPLVPAAISSAVGVDKAQVSRSVKRLLEVKMVERDQIRSPVILTRKGGAVSDRLLRLAVMRNRELTFDIGDEELDDFSNVIERLLQRAIMLYEQERGRGLVTDAKSVNPFVAEMEGETGTQIMLDRTRIISPLMTLSAYFSRSGALMFKRLTGLSNFEVWVLNEIGRDAPLEWNLLVDRLDRDHSQAGRTVGALIERGLVERQGRPGRRHGRFTPTTDGQRMFGIILEASLQRSAFLMAPLTPGERERFLTTFEKVHRNAAVQLERERTIEQLGE